MDQFTWRNHTIVALLSNQFHFDHIFKNVNHTVGLQNILTMHFTNLHKKKIKSCI